MAGADVGYCLGIDFGTTNTALTARFADGSTRLGRFNAFAEAPYCRSALFFTEADEGERYPRCSAGDVALRDCTSAEGEGRFVQSLKSFLASRGFGATQIYGRRFTLETLLEKFLVFVRETIETQFGGMPERTMVGTPVSFAYAKNDQDNDFARARLQSAFAAAGFTSVQFALEPISAAYAFQSRLAGEGSTVLVADFGGGTSDFALVRFEPDAKQAGNSQSAHRSEEHPAAEVLATSGVAVAGDDFDGKIVRHMVAPELGRGTTYVGFDGVRKEISPTYFSKLEQWHHLSFMNNQKTLRQLRNLAREADEPDRIENFIDVIEQNFGFHLHAAVRATKRMLSSEKEADFRFDTGAGVIEGKVTRQAFEGWIEPELTAIDGALTELLRGHDASDVDDVFMTGGTSFVPAVRALLTRRFKPGALRSGALSGGEELVSISLGLARLASR